MDDDERVVELSIIKAIFPELIVGHGDHLTASLDIPITPAKPLLVIFSLADEDEEGRQQQLLPHYISYFPPLQLKISVPPQYPVGFPPHVQLESEYSWVPRDKVEELKNNAISLWIENGRGPVLYQYIDYLQQMAENGFGLFTQERSALILPQSLKSALLNYDLGAKRQKFEQETFNCEVCLETKKGIKCHRLKLCGHVFCVECLQGYYNDCITDGKIWSVKCLALDCEGKRGKKKDITLEPSELLRIPLNQEIVQRYSRLKEQRRLESNRNTIYCPRKWCQGPSRLAHRRRDSSSDSDASENAFSPAYDPNDPQSARPPPSERLAICSICTFAFCLVCQTSWHGFYVPCPLPSEAHEIPGAATMDKATRAYLAEHTAACPGCSARCQKSSGCNKMTCDRCKVTFCYLCSKPLEGSYFEHFRTGKQCGQRLFALRDGDSGEEHELFWDPHAGDGETLARLFAEASIQVPSIRAGRGKR